MRAALVAGWLAAAHVLVTPARAQADEPSVDSDSGPAARESTVLHGFVLSAGVGAGLFRATSGVATDQRHFSGESLSLAVLMGGHLSRRFTLGGAYLRDQVFGLEAHDDVIDGDEPLLDDLTLYLNTISLFGDVMLAEHPELHLQAYAGRGWLGVLGRQNDADDDIDDPAGWVLGAALSSELRLAQRFAVGGALRVVWAPFFVDEGSGGGTDVDIVVPALLVTGRFD
jgi:hypothetical protein